ncbi:MAG TPA: phage capsid protein, partial [Rhodothermales bacterium]
MAESAAVVQYRDELVAEFEQQQSLVRQSTTTEATIKGNQATFNVAGSGGATAVTRGINGKIPGRGDNNTQTAVTLVEWHDLVEKTGFNIFQSQGDQRSLMQRTTRAVMNRKIDDDIVTELNTGTVNTGAAVTGSVSLVMKAKTILGNASVPWDSNLYALITPAMEAYLMQTTEFASREYINRGPFENADPAWRDQPLMYIWLGVSWCVHPNLPGAGGAAEKCFMYHKSAIG